MFSEPDSLGRVDTRTNLSKERLLHTVDRAFSSATQKWLESMYSLICKHNDFRRIAGWREVNAMQPGRASMCQYDIGIHTKTGNANRSGVKKPRLYISAKCYWNISSTASGYYKCIIVCPMFTSSHNMFQHEHTRSEKAFL